MSRFLPVVLAAASLVPALPRPAIAQGPALRAACLTAAEGGLGRAHVLEPSFLFVSPEERRPVASGSKLVLVRGDVPAPGGEALAGVVEEGYRRIVADLGFTSFPDRVSVSFADLEGSAEGYVTSGPGRSAEIVLDRALEGSELVRALAHQVGHLATTAYASEGTRWWSEATATWIEAKLVHEPELQALQVRLGRPSASITGGSAEHPPGSSTWLVFLESRFDAAIVSRIWQETAALGGDVVRATGDVLGALGSSLENEFDAYAAWLVAEDRRRAASGRELPHLPYAVDVSVLPARGRVSESGPEPLGVTFLHFDTSEVAGGIRLEIAADSRAEWSASAVVVESGSFLPSARASFSRASDGRELLAVPTSGVAEVVVAVANLGTAGPLAFSYLAASDDTYPFQLVRLEAAPEAGRVRLHWETAGESDVLGWSVLRSASAEEEFQPLNRVLMPGAAGLGLPAGAGYVFLDSGVEPGRTYSYYVEGLTSAGLTGSSHLVSVTLEPR